MIGLMNHIADANFFSALQPGEFENFLLRVGALFTIVVLLFTVVLMATKLYDRFVARKPPIDDDLKELREKLAGLAPSETVDTLIHHLANAATKDEVEKVRESLKGYVDQAQMDRRIYEVKELLARVETDVKNQITDLRTYLHNDVHEFRNMAQATWANAEEQREGLHSRINIIAEAVSEIRGWMRGKFRTEEQS